MLIEFLSDTNELAASDVLVFVREAIQKFENLRPLIIEVVCACVCVRIALDNCLFVYTLCRNC